MQPDSIPASSLTPTAVQGSMTPYPQEVHQPTIEFFHAFTPPTATAQTRRHTSHGTYLPPATARAKALLRAVFESYAPPMPLEGPLTVTLSWTYPWPGKRRDGYAAKATRPDLDNLAKLALDAATDSGYWRDDAQVTELHTAKFYGDMPGLAVVVTEETDP